MRGLEAEGRANGEDNHATKCAVSSALCTAQAVDQTHAELKNFSSLTKLEPILLELLLHAQLRGVAALLLAAVDGARVQAGVAPDPTTKKTVALRSAARPLLEGLSGIIPGCGMEMACPQQEGDTP